MGNTSKPLTMVVHKSLYQEANEFWNGLNAQGHNVTVQIEENIDIYLAPYAMRMTVGMQADMPGAIDLAIKGARELRYLTRGVKNVKAAKSRTRKNSTKQSSVATGAATTPVEDHRPVTGEVETIGVGLAASETTHE